MATERTLEQLQVTHSEMLATAGDLGITVPDDLALEFETTEVGETVLSSLDKLIRENREAAEKKAKAEADKASKPTAAKKAPKKAVKKAPSKETATTETDTTTKQQEKDVKATKKKPAKTAKKKAAPRAAKKSAKAAKKGAKRNGNDAKIVVLKNENPYGKGTNRWKRANAILTSKTTGEAKKKGTDSWTLRQLIALKLVKVEKAVTA